jgi:lipopolysaccharide/colanic/teichoic acid biosynthesis glycosyltransferase
VSSGVEQARLPARWEPVARRAVDLLVVMVALLMLAIPMLLIAMAIRLGTPGPALYRQQRLGRGGRPFTMYKFRTMRTGCSDAQHREMSLVGPRPCLDWEAEMFPAKFAERFDVPPGLTGLWQVSGRSTMGTLEMLELDLAYVRSWSFWTDVAILLRTVPALLRGHGAR